MTEEEWLAWPDPEEMLRALPERPTSRKCRLLGVACLQRFAQVMHADVVDLVEVTVRLADGSVDDRARKAARREALLAAPRFASAPRLGRALHILLKRDRELRPHEFLVALRGAATHGLPQGKYRGSFVTLLEWESDERNAQCDLLRDIFGNPFRPVAFDPAWRTSTAVAIAQGMYESRDFAAMPILADALQDAGCDDDAVLAHCRDPQQVHVRGCWVVDLVLGKS
jgi:hypothetical protein